MKSIISFLLVSFVMLAQPASAQNLNLIPNPGFEEYVHLPDGEYFGKQCLKTWTVPIGGSGRGDYYHENGVRGYRPSGNSYGVQRAYDGIAMTAICNYTGFKEYLQVKLIAPLVRDSVYVFTIHISCADNVLQNDFLNDFGVVFSDAAVPVYDGNKLLDKEPDLWWHNASGYNDRDNWTTLTKTYKAKGTEQVLLFGSFLWKEKQAGILHGDLTGITNAHYYIDGVALRLRELVIKGAVNIDSVFTSGNSLVLRNLNFATNKSVLDLKSTKDLDQLALYLKRNPTKKILITGHTDNVGDSLSNEKLSQERAESVKNYLIKKGISKNRMQTDGKGESQPIMPNNLEGGRLLNRRVVIEIVAE
ncbi:MAG: OmpA family protein [Bacteroidota bacterium]|jgi:outer membrane protein OmpA-like peptidoglycan-associated protein